MTFGINESVESVITRKGGLWAGIGVSKSVIRNSRNLLREKGTGPVKTRNESDNIWSDTNMEMEIEIPTSEKLDEIDLEHYLETQGA